MVFARTVLAVNQTSLGMRQGNPKALSGIATSDGDGEKGVFSCVTSSWLEDSSICRWLRRRCLVPPPIHTDHVQGKRRW